MSRCRGRAGGATTIARPAPGVAGNVITAAILDALVIHGLRPGPRRFDQDRIPIQAFFMGSMPGSVDPFVFGKLSIETLSRIANLPNDLFRVTGIVPVRRVRPQLEHRRSVRAGRPRRAYEV